MRFPRPHRLLHAGLFAGLLAAVVMVAAVGAAGAGAKPKGGNGGAADKDGGARAVIVAPRPGQRITGNHLRFVVRSGPEREDLRRS